MKNIPNMLAALSFILAFPHFVSSQDSSSNGLRKEYISVEILTNYKGEIRKTVGKNDILSQEQINSMNMADAGTDISVKVLYIPDYDLAAVKFTISEKGDIIDAHVFNSVYQTSTNEKKQMNYY